MESSSNSMAMVDSDLISNLPDKILIRILSFLPTTKSRTLTTVLSRRWRHLSPSAPFLDFPLQLPPATATDSSDDADDADASDDSDDADAKIENYRRMVDRCLDLYPNPTLHRLRVDDTCSPSSSCETPVFDRWIRIASSRSVNDLSLCFHHPCPDPYKDNLPTLSPSLFLCSHTLTSLNITSCRFPNLHHFTGFPSLKTLALNNILFTRNHEFLRLISGSPLLESLTIQTCRWVPNIVLRIAGTAFHNLKRFKFRNYHADSLAIAAPNLRFLQYTGRLDRLYIRSCPRLLAACFRCYGTELTSCEKWISIVQVIDTVEILVTSYWFFPQFTHFKKISICGGNNWCQHPEPKFKNLREFHCHGILFTCDILRALILYLCKSCSSLEKLCINLEFAWPGLPELHERGETYMFNERGQPYTYSADGHETMEELTGNGHNYNEEYHYYEFYDYYYELFRKPSRLPKEENLLPKLKMVTLIQFSDDRYSMTLVEFILGKAAALELLRVNFVQQQHVEMEQLHREILGFPRASPSVQIELSETQVVDYDTCPKCSSSEDLWS